MSHQFTDRDIALLVKMTDYEYELRAMDAVRMALALKGAGDIYEILNKTYESTLEEVWLSYAKILTGSETWELIPIFEEWYNKVT